jgi:hypothetical protein
MTETSISLLSILCGLISANLLGVIFKKYSFQMVGNSIAGVFGSIFFIKALGRLGFDPTSIMATGSVNTLLLILNLIVSSLGGAIAIFIAWKLKQKLA